MQPHRHNKAWHCHLRPYCHQSHRFHRHRSRLQLKSDVQASETTSWMPLFFAGLVCELSATHNIRLCPCHRLGYERSSPAASFRSEGGTSNALQRFDRDLYTLTPWVTHHCSAPLARNAGHKLVSPKPWSFVYSSRAIRYHRAMVSSNFNGLLLKHYMAYVIY